MATASGAVEFLVFIFLHDGGCVSVCISQTSLSTQYNFWRLWSTASCRTLAEYQIKTNVFKYGTRVWNEAKRNCEFENQLKSINGGWFEKFRRHHPRNAQLCKRVKNKQPKMDCWQNNCVAILVAFSTGSYLSSHSNGTVVGLLRKLPFQPFQWHSCRSITR